MFCPSFCSDLLLANNVLVFIFAPSRPSLLFSTYMCPSSPSLLTTTPLQEFNLAASVYYAMVEGQTSEQSARQSAMDSASKNAGQSAFRK